jgi:hypothetical protein
MRNNIQIRLAASQEGLSSMAFVSYNTEIMKLYSHPKTVLVLQYFLISLATELTAHVGNSV